MRNVLLALVSAGAVHSCSASFSSRGLSVIEAGRRVLLEQGDAISCATSGECGVSKNSCISIAGLAVPTNYCYVLFTDPGSVLGADASDGESLGVMAIFSNTTLTDAQDKTICAAWKADKFANDCASKANLHAIVASMGSQREDKCKNFNTQILELTNAPKNDTGTNETEIARENMTATQEAITAQVMNGYGTATGKNVTALSAAFTRLSLTWAWLMAPAVGYLEKGDIGEHIEGVAATCAMSHLTTWNLTFDGVIADLLFGILASDGEANQTHIEEVIVAEVGAAAAAEHIGSLVSNGDVPAEFATALGGVIAGSPTAMGELVVVMDSKQNCSFMLQDFQSVSFPNATTSPKLAALALGYSAITAGEIVAEVCSDAQNDGAGGYTGFAGTNETECLAAAESAALETDITCVIAYRDSFLPILGGLTAAVGAIIGETNETKAVHSFAEHMASCLPMDDPSLQDIFTIFQAARAGNASAWLEGAVVTLGCALSTHAKANDYVANGDQFYVSPGICYVPAIANTPVFQAVSVEPRAFTVDIVVGLTTSTQTMEDRCTAAGVPITAFPVFEKIPVPTTSVPSASPVIIISGASSLGASAVAAVAFLMLMLN